MLLLPLVDQNIDEFDDAKIAYLLTGGLLDNDNFKDRIACLYACDIYLLFFFPKLICYSFCFIISPVLMLLFILLVLISHVTRDLSCLWIEKYVCVCKWNLASELLFLRIRYKCHIKPQLYAHLACAHELGAHYVNMYFYKGMFAKVFCVYVSGTE